MWNCEVIFYFIFNCHNIVLLAFINSLWSFLFPPLSCTNRCRYCSNSSPPSLFLLFGNCTKRFLYQANVTWKFFYELCFHLVSCVCWVLNSWKRLDCFLFSRINDKLFRTIWVANNRISVDISYLSLKNKKSIYTSYIFLWF